MEKEVDSKIFLIAIIAIVVIVLISNNFNGLSGSAVTGKNIEQQVKCVFANSITTQKCYLAGRNEIGCSGIETCVVNVKGFKGERLTWKSSCGGYTYTTIIGVYNRNLYATFNCAETSKVTKTCYDSDNGKNYYVKGTVDYHEDNMDSTFIDKCRYENIDTNSKILDEGYCEGNRFRFESYECPNSCSNGVCIPKNITIKEESSKSYCSLGTACFFNVRDKKMVVGRTVTLVRVGSTGAVIVDIEGVQGTISSSNKKTIINKLTIIKKETFYDYKNTDASAAYLVFTV